MPAFGLGDVEVLLGNIWAIALDIYCWRDCSDTPRIFEAVSPGSLPAVLRVHVIRQRHSVVPRPADDRQDDPAGIGGDACGLEYLHGVFPGCPARWLRLHPYPDDLATNPSPGDHPRGSPVSAVPRLAFLAWRLGSPHG